MKVRELIAALHTVDPDLEVFFEDAEWGPEGIDAVSVRERTIQTQRQSGHFWDQDVTVTTTRERIVVIE